MALNTKYINDNMTVASIAEKMHILNKCLKCIYITMYTVKDNILGKKVCWRLATNQPKNCRKIGQRCELMRSRIRRFSKIYEYTEYFTCSKKFLLSVFSDRVLLGHPVCHINQTVEGVTVSDIDGQKFRVTEPCI